METDTQRLLPMAEHVAAILKALSHPARLRICCKLRTGELSVSELERELALKQPNLSRELAKLREEGLVKTRRESKAIFYQLANDEVERILDGLCAAIFDTPHRENARPILGSSGNTGRNSSRNSDLQSPPGGYGIFAKALKE